LLEYIVREEVREVVYRLLLLTTSTNYSTNYLLGIESMFPYLILLLAAYSPQSPVTN